MSDTEEPEQVVQWNSFGLDPRILAGIAGLGWKEPTEIQEAALPLALKGKDILSKARTGSGKTGAYLIPIVQRILHIPSTRALIVGPTRELCSQIDAVIRKLCVKCMDMVSIHELGIEQESDTMVAASIVIGTPGRILNALKAERLSLTDLSVMVLDEADLLFGFGNDKMVTEIVTYLPGTHQSFLMSATLSEQVEQMKKLTLRNPVTLKLDDSALPPAEVLQQYQINLNQDYDKYLVLLSFLKLRIVKGKSLVFACGTNRCYKLKLFLKQFGIPSVVLSSELAAASRHNAIEQFNKGKFDIMIANDQVDLDEEVQEGQHTKSKEEDPKKKKSKTAKEENREFGVSRGIDFQNVSNVLNFDFPSTTKQYIHRAGRTARGDNKGRVINLMIGQEERTVLDEITEITGITVDRFRFKMEQVDGLRGRATDALDLCSKRAIRDCRIAEIKQAILNSKKLAEEYFSRHENDLLALRHDTNLKKVSRKSDLANIPSYLLPAQIKNSLNIENARLKSKPKNYHKKGLSTKQKQQLQKKRKAQDPLKTKAKRSK